MTMLDYSISYLEKVQEFIFGSFDKEAPNIHVVYTKTVPFKLLEDAAHNQKKMCLLLNGNEYFIVLYSMPVSVG